MPRLYVVGAASSQPPSPYRWRMDAEEPTRTSQQVRQSLLLFLALCLAFVTLFCGFAYGAWPGASTSDRRDVVLAFLAIVGVGVLMVSPEGGDPPSASRARLS
jgi:hypothetical protein